MENKLDTIPSHLCNQDFNFFIFSAVLKVLLHI